MGIKGSRYKAFLWRSCMNEQCRCCHECLWFSLYIFLAEFSVFRNRFLFCVNIENMNEEKNVLKIKELWLLRLKSNVYKFSCRTTWHPIVVRLGSVWLYNMRTVIVRHEVYNCTTWVRNRKLLLIFDTKSWKMSIIYMLESFSWVLHWLKTSKLKLEGNIYKWECNISFILAFLTSQWSHHSNSDVMESYD